MLQESHGMAGTIVRHKHVPLYQLSFDRFFALFPVGNIMQCESVGQEASSASYDISHEGSSKSRGHPQMCGSKVSVIGLCTATSTGM